MSNTLYTASGCQNCGAVKRWLRKRNIPFTEKILNPGVREESETAILREQFRAMGLRELPIFENARGDCVSGFNPNALEKII